MRPWLGGPKAFTVMSSRTPLVSGRTRRHGSSKRSGPPHPLYYPHSSGLDRSAETRLRAVVDEVIATLDHSFTMQAVWEIAGPSRAVWSKDERETPIRFCDNTFRSESRVLR